MSANNITQLVQAAAVAYLRAANLSFVTDSEVQVREGISSADDFLPQVTCQCPSADAAVPFEGNWSALLRIELRSNANDTEQELHHENAGEVFGHFMKSGPDVCAGLSGLDGFTAQFVLPVQQAWEVNDNSWVSFMMLRVECAGSDFSIA